MSPQRRKNLEVSQEIGSETEYQALETELANRNIIKRPYPLSEPFSSISSNIFIPLCDLQPPHPELAPLVGNIPQAMQVADRWNHWQYTERNGKSSKIPKDTETGLAVSTTQPSKWKPWPVVWYRFTNRDINSSPTKRPDGMGFLLGNGFAGIDLDDCLSYDTDTSKIDYRLEYQEVIERILREVNSYTEVSPSGTGLKIFLAADLDITVKLQSLYGESLSTRTTLPCGLEVEMYTADRYFTVTGQRVNQTPAGCLISTELEERTAEFLSLYEEVFRSVIEEKKRTLELKKQRGITAIDIQQLDANDIYAQSLLSDANETWSTDPIFKAFFKGGHREAYQALGKFGNCPDYSALDLSFCLKLVKLCNHDPCKMDYVFHKSAMYRAKWDEIHYTDGTTYGQATIEKALVYFNPNDPEGVVQGAFQEIAPRSRALSQGECSGGNPLERLYPDLGEWPEPTVPDQIDEAEESEQWEDSQAVEEAVNEAQGFTALQMSFLKDFGLELGNELEETEFEYSYICKPLVAKGTLACICARSGTGKTTFLLSMLYASYYQKRFIGQDIPRLKTIYVVEGNKASFAPTLHSFGLNNNHIAMIYQSNRSFYDAPIEERLDLLEAAIEKGNIDLVILDNALQFLEFKDPNDLYNQAAIKQRLGRLQVITERTGATIILCLHPNANGTLANGEAWLAFIDSGFYIKKQGGKIYRRLTPLKNSRYGLAEDWTIRLDGQLMALVSTGNARQTQAQTDVVIPIPMEEDCNQITPRAIRETRPRKHREGKTQEQKIIDLANNKSNFTVTNEEVAQRLDRDSRRAGSLLSNLAKKGSIRSVGRGTWQLLESYRNESVSST